MPAKIKTQSRHLLADTLTPVSLYLRMRDRYPGAVLLESSDYHGHENSISFIGLQPIASIIVNKGQVHIKNPKAEDQTIRLKEPQEAVQHLSDFFHSFSEAEHAYSKLNGFFGYTAYDAVQYFENIELKAKQKLGYQVPDIHYSLFRFVIAINHYNNTMILMENLLEGEQSQIDEVESLLNMQTFATYPFATEGGAQSNLTDEEYRQMVTKGKEHCQRGDVFQIVLSRQFSQQFSGDEFNVYRQLRAINPSPYLFYFDYGSYKLFGSSPEAQITIRDGKAIINPIAGTFQRTGDDHTDQKLAERLTKDPKENSEHVMLVDLARNDLSRNTENVKVKMYREVQFFSHVIHLVSKVEGELRENADNVRIMADCFPAGTLSGAPKYKAMQLIDQYENQNRGFYGGCVGMVSFSGEMNQAIMIRTFLSKDNTLYYQAGAGIVVNSKEESELKEVNNKLKALKTALIHAGKEK